MLARLRRAALVLCVVIPLSACGGGDDDASPDSTPSTADPSVDETGPEGTLRMGALINLITFDTHRAQNGAQLTYLQPVFDTLISQESDGTLAPGLATDWGWLEDEPVFEMTIREGVAFHDGTSLDADVVVANLDRARDAEGPNAPFVAPIESVTADGDVVRMTFAQRVPTFAEDLTQSVGMVMSPESLDSGDVDANPVGSGPWRYVPEESARGERHVYTLFEDYWNPEVQGVEQVEVLELPSQDARLNALRSGEIDLASLLPEQVADGDAAGLEIMSEPTQWNPQYWGITIQDRDGTMVPELGDVRVRQALNYAVDRQAIADAVFFGQATPTIQPWAEGYLGYNADLVDAYSYDPERARSLLQEAGVADGFTFTVPALPLNTTFLEAVQAYFADVGVDMQIDVVEPGTLGQAGQSGDYPAFTSPLGLVHPHRSLIQIYGNNAPFNPFEVTNDRVAAAMDAGVAAGDDIEAQGLAYADLSAVIVEDAMSVIVVHTNAPVAVGDRVSGVQFWRNHLLPPPHGLRVEG